MCNYKILLVCLFICCGSLCQAQDVVDSTISKLQTIPVKYYRAVEGKMDQFNSRVTTKTEKTLRRLSEWENKIQKILQKASPETAAKLFTAGQPTFSTLLQKLEEGKELAKKSKASYDVYRDELVTGLKYASQQKEKIGKAYVKPIQDAAAKANEMEQGIANAEAVEKFIKQRKKQLVDASLKYIGKSKYLAKINKESYYYIETIRNYKEVFSDSKKSEEAAKTILNKIPAFQKFMQENSMLSSLFSIPAGYGSEQALAGLQTRAGINSQIQNAIAAAGPDAKNIIHQQLQAGQAELDKLKRKVIASGGGSSDKEIPDFKPNMQKTKTFLQRLQYGANIQFAKNNDLLPSTADFAFTLGYKINDKSIAGLGIAYKLGMGSLQHIKFSHQGLGFRSFIDYKLKKQFFISGGFEMNYSASFNKTQELKDFSKWQQAGLIGLTKKINIKSKIAKGTQLQVLYDMLHKQHLPASQPVIFRLGYNF